MKININNTDKVQAALDAVNGKAIKHVFSAEGIRRTMEDAEYMLEKLGLPKNQRKGARMVAVSGGSVPNAYEYSRRVTRVTLERGATGWFLVDVARGELFRNQSGSQRIHLTPDQDTAVIERLRRSYSIIREV